MEFIIITHRELSALSGLPYLQQLTYLHGIKPYVDYKTGLVGIRRGISYQSMSEALYIEPHSGIKSGSPSKDQLRRALKGLEKVGLIEIQSWERKLVLRCLLLDRHESVQNKPAIKTLEHTASNTPERNLMDSTKSNINTSEQDTFKKPEPTTPQDNNNYFFISLSQAFEEFWDLYPLKKEKENAFEMFKKLKPSHALVQEIMARLTEQIQFDLQKRSEGVWMPAWKYPANWLAQRCWETTSTIIKAKEYDYAIHETNRAHQSSDHLTRITKSSESTSFSDTEFQKLWKMH
ncbi:TPA: Vir protein [Legionella pneumophila]|nr:Vir protein [Legionella pneumophila]HAU2125182.1 Vir protein [Legionella pneumophila]HDU7929948.1 Vir protein [Legionella pneumophila]HDU7934766.1 Vir protein [Legionella pneumophila]HDU7961731.1 Vir protein [Legionella pneumophila]